MKFYFNQLTTAAMENSMFIDMCDDRESKKKKKESTLNYAFLPNRTFLTAAIKLTKSNEMLKMYIVGCCGAITLFVCSSLDRLDV